MCQWYCEIIWVPILVPFLRWKHFLMNLTWLLHLFFMLSEVLHLVRKLNCNKLYVDNKLLYFNFLSHRHLKPDHKPYMCYIPASYMYIWYWKVWNDFPIFLPASSTGAIFFSNSLLVLTYHLYFVPVALSCAVWPNKRSLLSSGQFSPLYLTQHCSR